MTIFSAEQTASGLCSDGGRAPDDPGQERHRILRELHRELERYPAVEHVHGIQDSKFPELRAELDPVILGSDADHATLRVAWWPSPVEPEFAFHYSESTGFDCGWHREPNPHVEGTTNFQVRQTAEADYEYRSISFDAETPRGSSGLSSTDSLSVWTVRSILSIAQTISQPVIPPQSFIAP